MKNFLIAFFTFIVWSIFALWIYFMVLPNEQKIALSDTISPKEIVGDKANATKIITKVTPTLNTEEDSNKTVTPPRLDNSIDLPANSPNTGLTATDGTNNIVFEFNKGISFIKNTKKLSIPLQLNAFKILLKDYLIQFPKKEVHIISTYSATENFVTPNIGQQRGIQLKNILTQSGIDSARIVVKSSIEDISFTSENLYSNAIRFEFKPLNKNRIIANIPQVIKMPKSITFSPEFDGATILKTKKLQNLVIRVTQILDSYPMAILTLVGHTDNAGTTEENYTLGLSFAKQLRWFLTAKGPVDKNRVRVLSKGESQPIKSNRTEKGGQANKRIVLQFK